MLEKFVYGETQHIDIFRYFENFENSLRLYGLENEVADLLYKVTVFADQSFRFKFIVKGYT